MWHFILFHFHHQLGLYTSYSVAQAEVRKNTLINIGTMYIMYYALLFDWSHFTFLDGAEDTSPANKVNSKENSTELTR